MTYVPRIQFYQLRDVDYQNKDHATIKKEIGEMFKVSPDNIDLDFDAPSPMSIINYSKI